MDRWTENLPILQDFVPYQGRGPKIDIHIQPLWRRGEEGGIMKEKERERRRRWRRRGKKVGLHILVTTLPFVNNPESPLPPSGSS